MELLCSCRPAGTSRAFFRQQPRGPSSRTRLPLSWRVVAGDPQRLMLNKPHTSAYAGEHLASSSSPSERVLEALRAADAVCFDVDSTVCVDEGIDELAAFCGSGEAVAEWTAKLSPLIAEVVSALQGRGTHVYLISGGFRQMIEPVAALLGVPKSRIIANRLLFHPDGSFAGFDPEEPTSQSGGKAVAVKQLRREHGYKVVIMIGDGATDLEARTVDGADIFIGYGGVQVREKVMSGSDWFVQDFRKILDVLE